MKESGWINERRRRPRAFISYRHGEAAGGSAAHINAEHRAWVEQFAEDLESWHVDVIWDRFMQEALRTQASIPPEHLPFAAEISTICPPLCHAFIPVLTPRYVERLGIGVPGGKMLTGGVQEEWMTAARYVDARMMNSIPVVRRGDHDYFDELPWAMKRHGGYDLRDDNAEHYETSVKKIAGFLHFERRHDDPPIDLSLADWIDLYIAWCRAHYTECAETPVAVWTWQFHRPNRFLDDYWQAYRDTEGSDQPGTPAIRSALTRPVKEPEPHHWGDNLVLAAKAVGEGGVGRPHLAATIAAYKQAQSENRIGHLAGDVITQNNLGMALALLGRIDRRVEPLYQALEAFRTALSLMPSAEPKRAITQTSLADALRAIAALEPGPERCREAVATYHHALEAIGHGERSMAWAGAGCGLGDALRLVAERTQSPVGLSEARQLLSAALAVFEAADKGEAPFIRPFYSASDGIRDCRQALSEVDRVAAELTAIR